MKVSILQILVNYTIMYVSNTCIYVERDYSTRNKLYLQKLSTMSLSTTYLQ